MKARLLPPIYLLVLPGFNESLTVHCLVQLRELGLGVALVGLTPGELRGAHGVGVQIDLTLDQVFETPPHLLVLSGGQMMETILTTEPRLRRLLTYTTQVFAVEKLALALAEGFFYSNLPALLNALTRCLDLQGEEDGRE